MKKRMGIGIIVLLLIAGGFFFFGNDLKFTGNAFLNTSSYSSSSDFAGGIFSNTFQLGSGDYIRLDFNITRVGSTFNSDPNWFNGIWDIHVLEDYAYVGALNNKSFSIINITNKSNPISVSHISDPNWFDGISEIYVSGNYAYVAGQGSNSFSIINITNKSNPVNISHLVDNGYLNGLESIFFSDDYVYIASRDNDSLNIINVTNKSNPIRIGSIVTGVDGWLDAVKSVFVLGNYAYLAASANDSISIINITNKSNPVIVGSLSDSVRLDNSGDVFVLGNYAYITSIANDSLNIINITNKSNPVIVGSLSDSAWLNFPIDVNVIGDYAYVSSTLNSSINIIDISNKSNPVRISSLSDPIWLGSLHGLKVIGDYAYGTGQTNKSLNIIKINETYPSGTYESEVINATYTAKWINLSWNETEFVGANISMAYRSCDDELCSGETYSSYSDNSPITLSVTNNMYFQFKANFTTTNLSLSPKLNSVDVFFSDDLTVPSATYTCTPFNARVGETITCVCSGTDGITGLGISSTSATIEITTSDRGEFTVSGCTVKDIAGNSASAIGKYNVLWSGGGVILSVLSSGEPVLQKTHVITKIIPGEETILSGFSGTGVKDITIEVNNKTNLNIKIKVSKYDSKPNEVSVNSPLKTYRYLAIDTQNLDDILEKATVKFEVDKTWVSDQGLDKNDLTILKFDESEEKWNELETKFDGEDDNFYYYTIELNSFSFFAIGEKKSIIEKIISELEDGYEEASKKENGLIIWWGIFGFLVMAVFGVGILITREIIALRDNNNFIQNTNTISSY